MRYIIKSTKTDAIIGNDGELRPSFCFGPCKLSPRIYKTRAGAQRAIGTHPWRRIVALDSFGCELPL